VMRRRPFRPQAPPPVRLSHAEEVGCCRCVQITESIQKYSGGVVRGCFYLSWAPVWVGGRIIDGKPRQYARADPSPSVRCGVRIRWLHHAPQKRGV